VIPEVLVDWNPSTILLKSTQDTCNQTLKTKDSFIHSQEADGTSSSNGCHKVIGVIC